MPPTDLPPTDLLPAAPPADRAAGAVPGSPGGRARRFRTTPGLVLGLVLMAGVVAVGVLAPPLLQETADAMGPRAAPASAQHPLGTDVAGHDMLARTLVATRLTLLMTAGATAVSVVAGVLLGTGVWLLPRRIREVCLRGIDTLVAFPDLLLALVVAAILGAGASSALWAIGIAGIPWFARFTANLAGSLAHQEFVTTSRLLGVGPRRMMTDHLLPNMAEPLLVLSATRFAQSLTAISSLSFVGLGVQSPQYDYGKLLNEALPALLSGRPIQVVGPAVLIVVAGLAATLVGDGLAAGADPRGGRSRPAARRNRTAPSGPGDPDHLVTVRDLMVTGPDGQPLVDGVSFGIRRAEVVGIVGESGSGKSLTAMALARLLPDGLDARADCLRLGDLDLLRPVEPRLLALRIGLVYQDPGTTFNPALRLGTQLTEVLRTHRGLDRAAARSAIVRSLESMHMTRPEHRLRQHPHELSGGMRQRAMIAAATATEPELLIADEPTTALDVTVQAQILRELRRLTARTGTAVLFISHDIEVVRALCDRVLVMTGGRIVEEVSAAELTVEGVRHPYTRALLEASPRLDAPGADPSDGDAR